MTPSLQLLETVSPGREVMLSPGVQTAQMAPPPGVTWAARVREGVELEHPW
jgi:hypothetical protein